MASRHFESLEPRELLSRSTPSFADFSSTAHLVTNGFGSAAIQDGKTLALQNDQYNQARSVWWDQTVSIDSFVSHFTFNSNAAKPHEGSAQGFTFTIQNNDTTQVGGSGGALGYQDIPNSVAVVFDLYTGGSFGSNVGIDDSGNSPDAPTAATGLDFHSGHTFDATVSYDGTTLSLTVTDSTDSSKTVTISKALNLPALVGGDNAFVGFTTGSGFTTSFLDIPSWDYVAAAPVTIATPAAASSTHVTKRTTDLSVLGASANGEDTLSYKWTTASHPGGAPSVKFSANGTNAAKDTIARFGKDGTYDLRCTISDDEGLQTMSDVVVVVSQKATSISITPAKATVHPGKHLQVSATVLDQFGHAMRTKPVVRYAIASGKGKIGSTTGLFTAGSSAGTTVVQAEGDNLVGSLKVLVE